MKHNLIINGSKSWSPPNYITQEGIQVCGYCKQMEAHTDECHKKANPKCDGKFTVPIEWRYDYHLNDQTLNSKFVTKLMCESCDATKEVR